LTKLQVIILDNLLVWHMNKAIAKRSSKAQPSAENDSLPSPNQENKENKVLGPDVEALECSHGIRR